MQKLPFRHKKLPKVIRVSRTQKKIHSADIQVGVSCATLICEIAGSVVTKIVFSKAGEIPKDA